MPLTFYLSPYVKKPPYAVNPSLFQFQKTFLIELRSIAIRRAKNFHRGSPTLYLQELGRILLLFNHDTTVTFWEIKINSGLQIFFLISNPGFL